MSMLLTLITLQTQHPPAKFTSNGILLPMDNLNFTLMDLFLTLMVLEVKEVLFEMKRGIG